MEEEKQDMGFKVQDRRLFSSETGEARKQEPPPQGEEKTASQERGTEESRGAFPEVTFSSFVLGLSTQALMCLGEIPNPQDGKPYHDLPTARQLIDILGLLKQKTLGNLEKNEVQLLDRILFDLRMKFVESVKQR
ncbi:MAG: DUF1844 domain-containing protein [Nitrospiria bacterium]